MCWQQNAGVATGAGPPIRAEAGHGVGAKPLRNVGGWVEWSKRVRECEQNCFTMTILLIWDFLTQKCWGVFPSPASDHSRTLATPLQEMDESKEGFTA